MSTGLSKNNLTYELFTYKSIYIYIYSLCIVPKSNSSYLIIASELISRFFNVIKKNLD